MYDYMYLMKIFGLLFIYVGSPTCKFFVSPFVNSSTSWFDCPTISSLFLYIYYFYAEKHVNYNSLYCCSGTCYRFVNSMQFHMLYSSLFLYIYYFYAKKHVNYNSLYCCNGTCYRFVNSMQFHMLYIAL